MKSVTYDAGSNMIIMSGGTEKDPLTMRDLYRTADLSEIPVDEIWRCRHCGETGMILQVGDEPQAPD